MKTRILLLALHVVAYPFLAFFAVENAMEAGLSARTPAMIPLRVAFGGMLVGLPLMAMGYAVTRHVTLATGPVGITVALLLCTALASPLLSQNMIVDLMFIFAFLFLGMSCAPYLRGIWKLRLAPSALAP